MHVAADLLTEFPGLHVVELTLTDLTVRRSDPRLEEQKARTIAEVQTSRGGLEGIRDEPIFRAYRDFYWKVGVDPTKTRPAAEALTRRALSGREIPRINTLVDACNLASLRTSISIAAFDAALIRPEALVLRRARSGEEFVGIGMGRPMSLEGVETVVEDTSDRKLIAIYPYRDADRTKVTEATQGVLLLMCGVPGIEDEALQQAGILCRELVTEFCRESSGTEGSRPG